MKINYLFSGIDKEKGFTDIQRKYLKEDIKENSTIVFIASTFNNENNDFYYNKILGCFKNININFKESYLIDDRISKEESHNLIKKSNIVFLMGGDINLQMQSIIEYELKELLKNKEGIIIGVSAGSMNQASRVVYKDEFQNNIIFDYEGISLTNISIYPHLDFSNADYMNELLEVSNYTPLIALPNDSFIKIKDDVVEYIGDYYKVEKGILIKSIFNKIISYYNLDELIGEPVKINIGITNEVYKINTKNKSYIIKILSSKEIDKIEKSEMIATICKQNNIKSLPALKINNKFVNNIENKNILVYEFYNGEILKTKELTLNHIRKLAKELSKIHKIPCNEKSTLNYFKNDYNKLYELTLNSDDDCFNYFKDNIKLLNKIYERVYETYKKLSNQVSYIHKDYNRKNILWNKEDFRIIDFETAQVGNPSIDFFNSLWFLTNDYQLDKLIVFVKEYFNNMNLIDDYKVGAYAALIEECNWLYFSLQRALKLNTNNEYEVNLGKESISSSLKEIINCYNKIDDMLEVIYNIK